MSLSSDRSCASSISYSAETGSARVLTREYWEERDRLPLANALALVDEHPDEATLEGAAHRRGRAGAVEVADGLAGVDVGVLPEAVERAAGAIDHPAQQLHADRQMAGAVTFAIESPYPKPEEALEGVWP